MEIEKKKLVYSIFVGFCEVVIWENIGENGMFYLVMFLCKYCIDDGVRNVDLYFGIEFLFVVKVVDLVYMW